MKNGKKIGKKVASGIMKFGEGAREAYAERYGTKPKKRKATKKVKPKKKVLIEKKTLKITLTNPRETISGKWEVWWGIGKLTHHKEFKTRPPATEHIAKLKATWRAKGYKIDYRYLIP